MPPVKPAALLLALLLVPVPAQTTVESPEEARGAAPEAMRSILARDLARHAGFLASDACQGRLTGTPGQVRTARYIARQFEKAGLRPLGADGGQGAGAWFQEYPVRLQKVAAASGLTAASGRRLHRFGGWFFHKARNVEVTGPLLLVGSAGISEIREARERLSALSRPAAGPDPAGRVPADLSGVIPVVTFPMDTSRDAHVNVITTMSRSLRLMNELKRRAGRLKRHGARAAVVITPRFNAAFLAACNAYGIYPGKPGVSRVGDRGERESAWMRSMMGARIPLLILEAGDAGAVLEAVGVPLSDAFSPGETPPATSREVYRLSLKIETEETNAANVVAWLPGRAGDLREEALILSAHMDHLGMGADGRPFNGADDNASGTAALLELAEAFSRLPPALRPRRSVIFLSVSGEELGLWGSAYYASHPTWPPDRIVANINMDMIGRSTDDVPEDAISLTPTWRHREYSTLAREAAFLGMAFDLRMENGDRFYRRSDHYNFARMGIPVVFLSDDEHEDYHMPTDDVEKLDTAKMERVVRLVFLLGYRTANREGHPRHLGRRTDWFGDPTRRRRRGR